MPMLFSKFINLPWCIKIELTHGCNLRCKFCPISTDKSLQDCNHWKFMSLELLAEFCNQFNSMRKDHRPYSWPRIELALRGEPLLNLNVLKCLATIRECLPACQVTMFSNGIPLLTDVRLLNALFDAGLNVLCLDCYNGTYERFRRHCSKHLPEDIELYDAHDFPPYRKHSRGVKRKVVVLLVGLEDRQQSLAIKTVQNVGGNVADKSLVEFGWKPKLLPLSKNCVRVFRELVFHCTGNIVLCCVDWYPTKATVLGNIKKQSVEEIWYGRKHLNVLRRLWGKNRNWGLCRTCDFFGGYRQGFLHNPYIEENKKAPHKGEA